MKGINRAGTNESETGIRKPEKTDSHKGAMTLEAALVLPVLLCAFFSVVFLIKAVYTYELVQHAMGETASEIASAGYIYHISGIRDIHDTVRNGINDRSELFKGQVGSVFDTYNSLKNMKSGLGQDLPNIGDSADLLVNAGRNFGNLIDEAENAVTNPLDELKIIASYIASGAFDDAKTQLFIPVVKLYMKKYLVTDDTAGADERLRALNVAGGFDGMDFSESSFLADRGENIDIIVRYRIQLPLPIQFSSGFEFVQRVRVKAWMGGDESQGVLDGSSASDDIWALSNFQRGLKIRRIFGANLPSNFPIIARFESGKAVMIKSMDLTAASYQEGDHAQEKLKEYMDELAAYKGQEKPWGSSGTVIQKKDIKSRELLLVIPQNKLSDANEKLLSDMVKSASFQGITLVVKRYGTKITESGKNDSSGSNDTEIDEISSNGTVFGGNE